MNIKILGRGCASCDQVEAMTRAAVAELGLDARFEHVRDIEEIRRYPIMATPGLVIDEKLVCAGRIPERSEVVAWLEAARK